VKQCVKQCVKQEQAVQQPPPKKRAGGRRRARETALQALYQVDVAGVPPDEVEVALEAFFSLYAQDEDDETRDFAAQIVRGCSAQLEVIDARIRDVSRHWRIERMARVDRNVMRLAIYELLSLPDVPKRVTLNEAVELAKRYGDENSASFVNGVLDKIASEIVKD
jgi:N utilization substance protein B